MNSGEFSTPVVKDTINETNIINEPDARKLAKNTLKMFPRLAKNSNKLCKVSEAFLNDKITEEEYKNYVNEFCNFLDTFYYFDMENENIDEFLQNDKIENWHINGFIEEWKTSKMVSGDFRPY